MYRTCLFCIHDLGANMVLETLPIGRRLAFDAAKGRLWVVCRRCEKWNLVPFESRLESIDACEGLFRGTRTRFSTDNIGIARLREGLELVRVGAALRPEFASWRYGDQFGRRRRRAAAYGGLGAVATLGAYYLGSLVGAGVLAVPALVDRARTTWRGRTIAAWLPDRDGISGAVSRAGLRETRLLRSPVGEMGLQVTVHPFARGRVLIGQRAERVTIDLWGEHAIDAVTRLLPLVNASGGSRAVIQRAVAMVDRLPLESLLAEAHGGVTRPGARPPARRSLHDLPHDLRLAVEMATQEGREREALAGELSLLERRWREADALAAIADGLVLPDALAGTIDAPRPSGAA